MSMCSECVSPDPSPSATLAVRLLSQFYIPLNKHPFQWGDIPGFRTSDHADYFSWCVESLPSSRLVLVQMRVHFIYASVSDVLSLTLI